MRLVRPGCSRNNKCILLSLWPSFCCPPSPRMLLKPREFREWLCRNNSNNNEIIADQQDAGFAVAQSLFYRMPLELRLYVLRLAFGGRTLHLEVLCPYDAGYDTRTWCCLCDRDVNWSMTQDVYRQVCRGRPIYWTFPTVVTCKAMGKEKGSRYWDSSFYETITNGQYLNLHYERGFILLFYAVLTTGFCIW